jgi:hypothetical protein
MLTNKDDENACFICFELKLLKERKPQRLKNQKLYIKTCQCDGFIHNRCLKTWYTASGKCPICRELMLNKNSVVAVLVTMNANENINNANENINNANENINNANENINNANENMGINMRIYVYIQKNWNKVATYSNIILILFMMNFYLSIFNKFKEDFKPPV